MSVIKTEEIAGANIGNETVCVDCMTKDDWKNLTESQVILDEDLGDPEEIYFCDRCKARMY
jgi:hypothetical protein